MVKELTGYTDAFGVTHIEEGVETVEVLYNKDYNAVVPTQGYENDFAYDLYSSQGVLVPPLTFKSVKIPTGFRVAFDPSDAGMHIAIRSGVAANTPLIVSNSPGIVEGTYRDGIKILVRNTFIDNRLVEFAFNVKGERVSLKDIPTSVLQRAKENFNAETKLLGYDKSTSQLEKEVFVTKVPAGTIYVAEGDRVAQMYFANKFYANFTEAETLPPSQRGKKGLGSSGVKKRE